MIDNQPLPYYRLAERRVVSLSFLPPDLAEFYSQYEGSGIDHFVDLSIRFACLSELEVFPSKGNTMLLDQLASDWGGYTGIMIAATIFGEEIYYTLTGTIPRGSILLVGCNVPPGIAEAMLLLSTTFQEWIGHLEQHDYHEDAVVQREDLPGEEIDQLNKRLAKINPMWDTSVR